MSEEEAKTLTDYLTEVIESGKYPDPGEVAREVLRLAPPEVLLEHILPMLRHEARVLMNRKRSQNPVLIGAGEIVPLPIAKAKPNAPYSARVAGIRQSWLSSSVHVSGEWKALGRCTAADLDRLASNYSRRASQLGVWAERYSKLAQILREHAAVTVDRLPDEVLDQLGGA